MKSSQEDLDLQCLLAIPYTKQEKEFTALLAVV